MDEKALEEYCFKAHKEAFENWPYGNPVKNWTDEEGNFCIEYEGGKWYHYAVKWATGEVEWW